MKAHILLIDDDVELISSLSDLLKRHEFGIASAISAEEAKEAIRRSDPDLIVLDLNLPEMSGFELCKELKGDSKTQSIPILILSARSSEPDRVMGLDLGADDYLAKPFGTREFLARV